MLGSRKRKRRRQAKKRQDEIFTKLDEGVAALKDVIADATELVVKTRENIEERRRDKE